MPIYGYRCRNGHTFEVIQAMSEDPVAACEECGAPTERLFHPVAVHFKGSGFYSTDYARKGAGKSSGDGDGGGSDSGSGSKSESESKTDSKSESESKTESKSNTGSKSDSGSGEKKAKAEAGSS